MNVATINENDVVVQPHAKRIRYGVRLSGAYVQAVRGSNVGEVVDLTAPTVIGNQAGALWGSKGPRKVEVLNVPVGYTAKVLPGADAYHWLLQLFTAYETELGAGAYSAALLADLDIYIEAEGRLND